VPNNPAIKNEVTFSTYWTEKGPGWGEREKKNKKKKIQRERA